MPPVMPIPRTGEPTPAIARPEVPRTVMKRSPAPWRVIDPGPSVVVFPNPLSVTIGRPCVGNGRCPDIPVRGIITPAPIRIEILRPVDVGAYIPVRLRALQISVALIVPRIPRIPRGGVYNLVLRIIDR